MDRAENLTSLHGFMDATGGVSRGLYKSLNCGLGSNDNPKAIAENRDIVAQKIAGKSCPVFSPYQIHGAEAVFVDDRFDLSNRPKADALVTNRQDILIGVLTADCCPVLLEAPSIGLVGVAHAGWKGAAGGIVEATVALMEDKGADRVDIRAALGPTIAQISYEVGDDMRAAVLEKDESAAPYFAKARQATKYLFDLPGYVANQLAVSGITNSMDLAIDTYTSPRHFSYRRSCHRLETDYGRFLSVIMASYGS